MSQPSPYGSWFTSSGLVGKSFVLLQHLTGYGQEEVGDGFHYFDGAEHFAGIQCFTFGRDVDKHNVAQLLLCIIGDTYIGYIAFQANPFVFFGVLYILGKFMMISF